MTSLNEIGGFATYATLSGLDGIFGMPFQPNSLGILKGSVVASGEALEEHYMANFTATATCNASGITKLHTFALDTALSNNLGVNTQINCVDGDFANTVTSSTLYDRNELFFICSQPSIGANNKNIAFSISINLVEQIHNQDTSILTN